MKRTLLLILVLLGTSAIVNGQAIIRSGGVVRRTTNVVKIEQEEKGKIAQKDSEGAVYDDEIGTFTHSAGALVGTDITDAKDEDSIIALDYNLQYRFNPLFSAGVGVWCGLSDNYEGDFGMNLRANLKLHPIATIAPGSKYQPYLALWGEWLIPNDEVRNSSEGDGTNALAVTTEVGCDIYGGRFPFYISLNTTLREDYKESSVGQHFEYPMVCLILKGGIRF